LITDERNGRRRMGAAILAGELAYALLMGRRLLVEVVVIVVMVGLWFGRGMRLSQAASRVAAIGVVLFIACRPLSPRAAGGERGRPLWSRDRGAPAHPSVRG